MFRFLTSALIFVSGNALSETNNTIHWLQSEMPPAHILEGEHKGTGYADLTMQLLIDSLTEYQHIKVLANYKRSEKELATFDNRCHTALLKSPDRENFIEYSNATYVITANKLFVLPNKSALIEKYLTTDKKVKLAALLDNEPFILGVSSGAKYGAAIDKALQLPSSQDNLAFRSAIDHYSGLSGMLQKYQRLDGFLGLAIENRYFQPPGETLSEDLVSYSIDGVDDYLLGYIGCSKSVFGKTLINKINKIIDAERNSKIKNYYQSWLLNKDIEAHNILIEKLN